MFPKKSIYFIFPHQGVGGVSILFLRLAHKIAADTDYKCVLVDYPDGYMAKRANRKLVDVLHYTDEGICTINHNALVLFQSMTPWSIFPNLRISPEANVVFWSCHPMNFAVDMPGVRNFSYKEHPAIKAINNFLLLRFRVKVSKFITYLDARHGLVFMDKPNFIAASEFSGTTLSDPRYVPIPAPSKHLISRDDPVGGKGIHFCWVGRIVDFKYFILERFIEDLSQISALGLQTAPISLTIVGTGSHWARLRRYALEKNHISVMFIETMDESEIDSFLTSDVDILAAMGTSALEGAKYGVPTILLDFSYKAVDGSYIYDWLFHRDGYSLGDDVANLIKNGDSVGSLNSLINEFTIDASKIRTKTYSYFKKNHSIDIVAKKLLSALDDSTVHWGDLERSGLIKPGFIYRFFQKFKRYLKR